MGFLARFRGRGALARIHATLAAVEDLLRPDLGSPRDEPRVDDPRYLEAARMLRAAAPAGYRDDGESKVPRFPVIALLRRGTLRTFRFAAAQPGRGGIADLEEHLGPEAVYVHSEQVDWICRGCARDGRVPHRHERQKPDLRIVYGKLIVEERELSLFRDALDRALAKKEDLALYCPALHRALGDEARAAADDAAWTGLELN